MAAFADEISSLQDMRHLLPISDIQKIFKRALCYHRRQFLPWSITQKFKARLVARGDMLKIILDPDTYAGTVSTNTLRLLLSLVAEHELDLVSHDIKTAFLYPDLKPTENIYLRRPNGVTDDVMPSIVKLKKCLMDSIKRRNSLMNIYHQDYWLWDSCVACPMQKCLLSRVAASR